MKQKIITGIAIIGVLIMSLTASVVVEGQREEPSKEELQTTIDKNQNIKDHAHNMAESARVLGWTDDDKLIEQLQDKWYEAHNEQQECQEQLNAILEKEAEEARKAEEARLAKIKAEEEKWATKQAEYPAATTIWRYMKNLGWNDYVCAGIMGNIMAEVGGQSLNIQYTLSSKSYYGMCQWSRGYGKVWGAGLTEQCNFLRDTIQYELNTYGKLYQKGFNFNSFLNLQDCRAAAEAFRACYERSSTASRQVRKNNAVKAYNYFVN